MKFLSRKSILLFSCVLSTFLTIKAQTITKNTFGKGIKIIAADSSFFLQSSLRLQNRYEGILQDSKYSDQIFLRRARLKFDGFVYSPKVKFKLEADIINGDIKDAVVKWNFHKGFELWIGQAKLPGNRERVISSQKLQFVDRSQLNSTFTLDRDKGLQLRHQFNIGKMVFREAFALSQGEGPNVRLKDYNLNPDQNGKQYTFRLEFLPFGQFTSKGDYFGSDLKREPQPKLSIGGTFDFNHRAIRARGNTRDFLVSARDIRSYFIDMMFKYRGLSFMGEYTKRAVNNNIVIPFLESDRASAFYTGQAINLNTGYLFKNNIEIAIRYTQVNPDVITDKTVLKEYTLGLSKYIVGHHLKIQSDITKRTEIGFKDLYQFRLQVEVAF